MHKGMMVLMPLAIFSNEYLPRLAAITAVMALATAALEDLA